MKNINKKFSIIMPAYNEAERICTSIEETAKTFYDFGCDWELIVFDDFSSDNTFDRANTLVNKYPKNLIVKRNLQNIGKGRAVKKAFRYVTGEYVVFLDADLDLHPAQIQILFDIMRLDDVDIVIGSKMHPNSVVKYSCQRWVISFVYYMFIRIFFNLPCRDTQTGLKLFKASVLREVFPRILVKKFAFDLEILVNAQHLGFRIAEAPIVLNPTKKFNRIGIKAIVTTFWDSLAIFYRMYVLKYYDNIDHHRRKNLAKKSGAVHK